MYMYRNSLAIVLSAFYYNNLSSDPLTFSAQKFFVYLFIFSDCKKSSYIWKFEEGVKIHPDQAFSANPKNISKDNFLDYIQMLTPRWPYVYMYLHLISAIFILNAHEQFVLFLCNTSHEMLLRMLFMCFWLTLYINVYDLYKHLVVNQLVFTCYLLQNSNTWEMSLKYGIFFLMLSRKCCAYNSSLFSVLLQCTCQTDIPWRFKGITWTQF